MTKTEIKSLDLVLDEELREQTNALDGYTISNRGVIYDPSGEELTTRLYRGKPTVSINGLLLFYDYAVCKLFHANDYKSGLTIGYKDGDCQNVDVDNLYWRPRIIPPTVPKTTKPRTFPQKTNKPDIIETAETIEKPTPQTTKAQTAEPQKGWIRLYDKKTCELLAEYGSWREAFLFVRNAHQNTNTPSYRIKYNIRRALRYGDIAYGCYWRASGGDMLGRRAHRHLLSVLSEAPTPKAPTPKAQPEGWIRRYTPDGALIAEYGSLEECLQAIMKITTQSPTNIRALIRRNAKGLSDTYLGAKWEVSDISILGKPRKPRAKQEAPTPQPEQEQKMMERKHAPTDTSAPIIVEVEGIANPIVEVRLVKHSHYVIKISPSDR